MEKDKTEGEKKDGSNKKRGRPLGSVARERTWSGSVDMKCLDEYLKRERVENTEEEEEESEVFKKSKLTMRSPKSEKNVEKKIEDLTRVIMEMEGKLREKLERFFREEFTRWKTE